MLKVQKTRTPYKYKALKLIAPEYAAVLGVPAEAPVFCSPYIVTKYTCDNCGKEYTPLVYQVGRTTVAQHFCKYHGGGIYVFDPTVMDNQGKQWVYRPGLWLAKVNPIGPIRIGYDKGFTFQSVTPLEIHPSVCHMCKRPIIQGSLYPKPHDKELLTSCDNCRPLIEKQVDWHFTLDEHGLHFTNNKQFTIPPDVRIFL